MLICWAFDEAFAIYCVCISTEKVISTQHSSCHNTNWSFAIISSEFTMHLRTYFLKNESLSLWASELGSVVTRRWSDLHQKCSKLKHKICSRVKNPFYKCLGSLLFSLNPKKVIWDTGFDYMSDEVQHLFISLSLPQGSKHCLRFISNCHVLDSLTTLAWKRHLRASLTWEPCEKKML